MNTYSLENWNLVGILFIVSFLENSKMFEGGDCLFLILLI